MGCIQHGPGGQVEQMLRPGRRAWAHLPSRGLPETLGAKSATMMPATVVEHIALPTDLQSLMRFLPSVLLVTRLCGVVVGVFRWCTRWRRVFAAVRDADPLRLGREVEILRRLE
jgi:hypothetical protein